MSDAPPDPTTDPADPVLPDGPRHRRDEVEAPVLAHKPFLRLGYDRAAVDEFVTKVVLAVHDERQTSVRADEVARTRFPSRRLGSGYRMRDVDDYLGVAEALLRLREATRGAGSASSAPEETRERHHHRTWWIYGVAAVLAVAIIVFTVLQT